MFVSGTRRACESTVNSQHESQNDSQLEEDATTRASRRARRVGTYPDMPLNSAFIQVCRQR